MLAMKIIEKPKELIGKIITLQAQSKDLESDYNNGPKLRGEIYIKRKSAILNKLKYFRKQLANLGVDNFTEWEIEIQYLDEVAIGPTEFNIRFNSHYDKIDVETIIQFRYNCLVMSCKKIKDYSCGDIILIKK